MKKSLKALLRQKCKQPGSYIVAICTKKNIQRIASEDGLPFHAARSTAISELLKEKKNPKAFAAITDGIRFARIRQASSS